MSHCIWKSRPEMHILNSNDLAQIFQHTKRFSNVRLRRNTLKKMRSLSFAMLIQNSSSAAAWWGNASHSGGLRQYVSKVHTGEFISDACLFHCALARRWSDVPKPFLPAIRTFPHCRHAPSAAAAAYPKTQTSASTYRALIKTQPYVTNCELVHCARHFFTLCYAIAGVDLRERLLAWRVWNPRLALECVKYYRILNYGWNHRARTLRGFAFLCGKLILKLNFQDYSRSLKYIFCTRLHAIDDINLCWLLSVW